jgi:hypothetical protein
VPVAVPVAEPVPVAESVAEQCANTRQPTGDDFERKTVGSKNLYIKVAEPCICIRQIPNRYNIGCDKCKSAAVEELRNRCVLTKIDPNQCIMCQNAYDCRFNLGCPKCIEKCSTAINFIQCKRPKFMSVKFTKGKDMMVMDFEKSTNFFSEKEMTEPFKTNINNYTVKDLQKFCRERDLADCGSKKILVDGLLVAKVNIVSLTTPTMKMYDEEINEYDEMESDDDSIDNDKDYRPCEKFIIQGEPRRSERLTKVC